RRISRLVVVLPQPDSPTSPSVLPLGMVKLTPSTARTWPTTRLKKPCVIGKSFFRSRTSSRFVSTCGAVIRLLPPASLRSLLGEGRKRLQRCAFAAAWIRTRRLSEVNEDRIVLRVVMKSRGGRALMRGCRVRDGADRFRRKQGRRKCRAGSRGSGGG